MRNTFIFFLISLVTFVCHGQKATIKEELISLDTYNFDGPNPVPIVTDNPKIFPYYKFESYQLESKKKNWKVVTLENDYIKVMILPEIGGKVWGAIEKTTGEEFLYKNEVIKFRNIAMRGPWTSGGIEFNFGVIGHHPSTATPVDYLVRNNSDGSVSCFVGSADLPSNTQWRVEIRLEKDKAYFETNASWYNASAINQSYYNWMTAAAVATPDLEFFIPGNSSLEHNGDSVEWPIDKEGRDLSFYKNNNFGPDKSYHIVGEYNDFFGGYYHDTKFGFGQWAPYEEMPGQKLWLWSQARSGGIWEDLLTDTDGQYIEFQAGRLLNQYFPGTVNPISQANFEPYVMDSWREIWFPYKDIGGMESASEYGVLNVEKIEKGIYIGFNALQNINEELKVYKKGQQVFSKQINLKPMEIFSTEIDLKNSDDVEVIIGNKKLYYNSDKKKTALKRPFVNDENIQVSNTQKLYYDGWEALKYREFNTSLEKLTSLVELDPSHQDGLVKLAELEYRRTNYDEALDYVNTVLKMDTYNYNANYFAGLIYREKKDYINSLESFGWAARSIKYRSVSYAQMAEVYVLLHDENKALEYAQKALNFNSYNLNARQVLLLIHRKNGNQNYFKKTTDDLLRIDPLNHFVKAEQSFAKKQEPMKLIFMNEFPDETVLEMAIKYCALGYNEDALTLLKTIEHSTKAKFWIAYIYNDIDASKSNNYLKDVTEAETNFVFPYRRETVPVLEWANSKNTHWKLKYYLAQNYIAVGKIDEGKALLRECNDLPDSDVFYRFRAKMLSDAIFDNRLKDYKKALQLNKKDWRLQDEFIHFYLDNKKYEEAQNMARSSYKKFPNSSNIGLGYAKALLKTGQHAKAIKTLKGLNILPFEHASESKEIYTKSHVMMAYNMMEAKNYNKAIALLEDSKEWPENLGVGRPFDPDERMQDYLLARCHEESGNIENGKSYLKKVADYNINTNTLKGRYHLFGYLAQKRLGKAEKEEIFMLKLQKTKTKWTKLTTALLSNNLKEKKKLIDEGIITNNEMKIIESAMKF